MPRGVWTRPRDRQPVEDRFWSHVDRRSYDECWPWLDSVNPKGYGKFTVQSGQLDLERCSQRYSHVVAFRLIQGRWPDPCGLHGCDNPACCNAENPAHVHEGTRALNNEEMRSRGRAVGPPIRYGERAGRSRLTDEQARQIFERWWLSDVELSQSSLAREFGVTQQSVSYIVRGRRTL